MKKIEKMVADYNKYATKHGYPTIMLDIENKKIIGEYVPRDENEHKGFFGYFKNLKIAYNNGYLKSDFDNIINEIKKVTIER